MINKANGIDNSLVISKRPDLKGIGNEITLDHDVNNIQELNKYLLQLSEKVGLRLRNEKKYTNVIVIILKDNTFKKYSHQKKLNNPTNDSNEIYLMAKLILKEIYNEEKIRLIGIRLDKLPTEQINQLNFKKKTE